MKGIAILLVCLGHCITLTAYPLNRWILSFHMPLFFFVSGMLLNRRFSYSLKTFLCKNIFSLVVPQITGGFLAYAATVLIKVVILKKMSFSEINFLNSFSGWFLPTLFCMNLLMYCLSRVYLLKKYSAVFTFAVLLGFFLFMPDTSGLLLQTVCAAVFGMLGMFIFPLVKKWEHYEKLHGIGIIGLVVCAVLSYFNDPIKMFANGYGNRPLFLLTAFIGILSMIDLSLIAQNIYALQYFGRYSIVVYVTHMPFLDLLHRGYRYLITGSLENHGKYPHFLIMFLIVLCAEIVIVPLAVKLCPLLFGISKPKKDTVLKEGGAKTAI